MNMDSGLTSMTCLTSEHSFHVLN